MNNVYPKNPKDFPKDKKEMKEMVEEKHKSFIQDNYHDNWRRKSQPYKTCQKCGSKATVISVFNEKLQYQLCDDCYLKRSLGRKPRKKSKED